MSTRKEINAFFGLEAEREVSSLVHFQISVPASRLATLSSLTEALEKTAHLVLQADPTPLLRRAEQVAEAVVESATPNESLLLERIAQRRSMQAIIEADEWLTAEQINEMQTSPPANKNHPASDWKRRGRIYSVDMDGKDHYASYQFDVMGRPLPIIKDILAALGSIPDSWSIASWFHYPNGWIAGRNGSAVAPKEALDRPADVIKAASKRLRSYQA
ncbi:hypothetical protein [Xanthomonas hortorum]|uniref:Uncharacterized protein n=1 Tax=Xanthomonas hortorum pv. vitians TaxID=83224 RepID=A0A6V7DAE1_9XANT|nr:hypothetical protein [Xanthomonas hortorum]MCC8494198.1 hypothetical protein [Xanthomonas hortorum pv. gardneri]MCE4304069.1 hypothetical protein [Xanthomonas hortorum pv. vitians]MCE4518111.1 hypothetical protein [Xanthomonas hortorum pv. vitians]MCE4531116.1 hypothetical protein [Xanthomonas hortorum pv. vitians]MCE4552355.1 hypothetical protein [Xanthomonas hortorum pv. vitians]